MYKYSYKQTLTWDIYLNISTYIVMCNIMYAKKDNLDKENFNKKLLK